ncbi:uncharacterized protein FOMMEDRAFT_154661 [Fomitiporia mediterranea MF3/22]|uniref:uncharacterized protein n=1 Tax=Fomitiporia mediterranea (strain MF3/22) TaxID=694068 RepID=UPI0004408E39|nr:uncharacterized protein FOMMEDRAFT_154661 [Fomitiporia mediterranea MF3/22]EJD03580.1 hypothetical protein FOMMEDRAFT_154661 [Fomitiporia mediterranea MF3/22]
MDASESARPTLRISICMHHSHSLHAATARTPREYTPQSTVQFTAPPIARRSQSMQCARTDAASPAAQISSFNAP